MKTVLITGVTGYIGGALAAAFLARGHHVVALARNDSRGERATSSVRAAATGFGAALTAEALGRLRVLPNDLGALPNELFRELDAVWHCAAEMSFASRRLESSFAANVGDTHALYTRVRDACPQKPRFNYVSTAYTGGIEAAKIDEVLHLSPKLVNPYFVSKWSAELMLAACAGEAGALPVTLFRPSIVVGHTRTGWYGGKSFGPYNFIDGFHVSASLGNRSMRLDIDPEISHNYVGIDDVVNNALALTTEPVHEPSLSIVHAIGSEVTNAEGAQLIANELGVRVEFGAPRTVGDHALASWVFINQRFNQRPAVVRRFPLVAENLRKLLGQQFAAHPVDTHTLAHLTRWYCRHRLALVSGRHGLPTRLPMQATRLLHASGLERAVLPKRQAARLLLSSMARAYFES
ncbi:MAG TPA: SDR family oxidoreductase [Polyangiaceae bacterium]|nr:SDR family oxidoreductase [Polyangiaceae bacterium]